MGLRNFRIFIWKHHHLFFIYRMAWGGGGGGDLFLNFKRDRITSMYYISEIQIENKFAQWEGKGGRQFDKDTDFFVGLTSSGRPWQCASSPQSSLLSSSSLGVCLLFLLIIISAQLPPALTNMASASHLMIFLSEASSSVACGQTDSQALISHYSTSWVGCFLAPVHLSYKSFKC